MNANDESDTRGLVDEKKIRASETEFRVSLSDVVDVADSAD